MNINDFKFTDTPCRDAAMWLESQPDAKTAWDTCERGDWMWWALCHIPGAVPSKEISAKYNKWSARRAGCKPYIIETYDDEEKAALWAGLMASNAAWKDEDLTGGMDNYLAERLAQAKWIRKHVACPVLP